MKRASKDLIDFFQLQNSDEKNRLLAEYITEAMRQIGIKSAIPDDGIRLMLEKNEELPGTLRDFSSVLYDKIMEGVCNVIATA